MKNTMVSPESLSALEQYGQFLDGRRSRFVAEPAPLAMAGASGARQKSYRINPLLGQGWADMHAFGNGLTASRMLCRLDQAVDDEYQVCSDNVRLGVVLSGHERVLASRQMLEGRPGDIFLRNAYPETLHIHVPQGVLQMGVALDIPRAMLDVLQEQGTDAACFGQRGTCAVLRPSAQAAAGIRRLGQRMLALQARESLLAQLELESCSLELLLAFLMAFPSRQPSRSEMRTLRWQAALDDALDILHAEWSQPLSIALLARRAGINECYLKAMFRERTGQTIAGYLRELRMRHARDMLESGGCTVQQAAYICGYSRADRFSEAFRRVHGILPSALR